MNPHDLPPNPDYLAKDFNSFRTLMLDHLAVAAPDWAERHAADVGITLVELLAYVGDYLSYYQDAVAAEAYLATARQRDSVRRHARLVDYRLGEGSSARVWVQLTPASDGVTVARGTPLLTRIAGQAAAVSAAAYAAYSGEVFETMHDLVLQRAQSSMPLAPRAEPPAAGATRALLAGRIDLHPGQVLLLCHGESGFCHPVRLIAASHLGHTTEIAWHRHDALPAATPAASPAYGAWVAHGNIVLADQGRTTCQALPPVPVAGGYAPVIAGAALSYTRPCDPAADLHLAAAQLLQPDPDELEPAITVHERPRFAAGAAFPPRPVWTARRDLLHARDSDRFLAAEPDGQGNVRLRFGDGRHGRRPQPEWQYEAEVRTGAGVVGNIGPGALHHIVSDDARITKVNNPLAAIGGRDPETLIHARAAVPLKRATPRRCVIGDDYRAVVAGFPDVAAVHVDRRWQDGRPIVVIAVRRASGRPVDAPFAADLRAWLAPVRLIGDTLEIGAQR